MSATLVVGPPTKKEAGLFREPATLGRASKQWHNSPTAASPLTLHEAQQIAESIVGALEWNGASGYCVCPGASLHTTATTTTDCKVVCETIGTLPPGVYCFHDSCKTEVDNAAFAVRSALGKRSPSLTPRSLAALPRRPQPPEAKYDAAKLKSIARPLDGIGAEWFAARSPKRPDNRTPASFLHELYAPGEKVVVFDVFKSQGVALWTHRKPPFDARELDTFRSGQHEGVWFLANPVTGEFVETGELHKDGSPRLSRRSGRTITSWRYLVLESDQADSSDWLAVLAQMPIPIAAIYTSGGRSIHALIRLDAESKAHWDAEADKLKPALVTLGADRGALTAVRLTRLPCCDRLGSTDKEGQYTAFPEPRLQRLLYLNGKPDCTPICERRTL